MSDFAFLPDARRGFHAALLNRVLYSDARGVPTNADKDSRVSVAIATGILNILGSNSNNSRLAGQMAGNHFEVICKEFLETVFPHLNHLRPGTWSISRGFSAGRLAIAQFEQYSHLAALDEATRGNPQLAAALGGDYLIKPDIVIIRQPESDLIINAREALVDERFALLTSLRQHNNHRPILHASISCKWTLRSDRAQNARSEGLNLVRNRKGRLPHVIVITGEPTPNRIASIALGTGDIDCVYHFALPELLKTVQELQFGDAEELLHTMIDGNRLRDIADLPLDLVI